MIFGFRWYSILLPLVDIAQWKINCVATDPSGLKSLPLFLLMYTRVNKLNESLRSSGLSSLFKKTGILLIFCTSKYQWANRTSLEALFNIWLIFHFCLSNYALWDMIRLRQRAAWDFVPIRIRCFLILAVWLRHNCSIINWKIYSMKFDEFTCMYFCLYNTQSW